MSTKATIMRSINSSYCDSILEKSSSLNARTNPFMQNISKLSAKELEVLLGQYCHFPRNLISILVSACYTMGYHDWEDVVSEIRENIFSELGGDYDKIDFHIPPHYSMLRKALEKGLSFDINKVFLNSSTRIFIKSLSEYMTGSVENSAGAVYALEATAINELQIVYDITRHLFEIKKKSIPNSLKKFFEVHINDIEVGHRNNLFDAVEKEIKSEKAAQKFYHGFQFVVDIMDIWWDALYKETKVRKKHDQY